MIWKKKKPSITFEIDGEFVNVKCEWPKLKAQHEKSLLAQNYTSMLLLILGGKLLPSVQRQLALAGDVQKDDEVAETVLRLLNQNIGQIMRFSEPPMEDDGPVIPPSMALRSAGE